MTFSICRTSVEEEAKPPRVPSNNTEPEAVPEPTCPYVVALQTLKACVLRR